MVSDPTAPRQLSYRTGTYATYLERMLLRANMEMVQVGTAQPLYPLQTLNLDGSTSINTAFFKAWAVVLDVLSFYQERIANEAYLKTATESRSITELAQTVGCSRSPGVAASTYLAFTIIDAKGESRQVSIQSAVPVQNTPKSGPPVIFETIEPVEAHVDWNSPKPYVCQRKQPDGIAAGATSIRLDGTRTGLHPGSHLLIVGSPRRKSGGTTRDPEAQQSTTATSTTTGPIVPAPTSTKPLDTEAFLRIVSAVETDKTRNFTRVTWIDDPASPLPLLKRPQLFVMKQQAHLFGADAPQWQTLNDATRRQYGSPKGGLLATSSGSSPDTSAGNTSNDSCSEVNSGLPLTSLRTIAILSTGSAFVATDDGLFRAEKFDPSAVWTSLRSGIANRNIYSLFTPSDGNLYAGGIGIVLRSQDDGQSWEPLRGGVQLEQMGTTFQKVYSRLPAAAVQALVSFILEGKLCLVIGMTGGVLYSPAGNDAWVRLNSGFPEVDKNTGLANVTVHTLFVSFTNDLFAGTNKGVFHLNTNKVDSKSESRWEPYNGAPAPPPTTQQTSPAVPPAVQPTGVFALAQSTKPHGTWLFAGTDHGVYRCSLNGGQQPWQLVPFSSTITTAVHALVVQNQPSNSVERLWAATDLGLMRSDDQGVTWQMWNNATRLWQTPDQASQVSNPKGAIRAVALAGNREHILASTDFDGVRETEWPNFTVTPEQLDLDRPYIRAIPGSLVALATRNSSAPPEIYRLKDIVQLRRKDYTLSAMVTRLHIDTTPLAANSPMRIEDFDRRTTLVYFQSQLLPIYQEPSPLKLPIQKRSILIAGSVPTVNEDRQILIVGNDPQRAGDPVGDPSRLVSELCWVTKTYTSRANNFTRLTLREPLTNTYDPDTVSIYGNIAAATHGETIKDEVVGSGNASRTFQEFTLSKSPVTYVNSPSAGGAISTLSIDIKTLLIGINANYSVPDARIRWQPVETLIGQPPSARIYTAAIDDANRMTIQFGDGIDGQRLPSGQQNITATYRTGSGTAGNLPPNTLILPKNRPPGVRTITNPLAASGGVDPEGTDTTRARIPHATRNLNRIVSLRDYEDFALMFTGIEKAQIKIVWNSSYRVAHLTVVPNDETLQTMGSQLYTDLHNAIQFHRASVQPFELAAYQPLPFYVRAYVEITPDITNPNAVTDVIRRCLQDALGFDQRSLGQNIAASEVTTLIQNVAGVRSVRLDRLQLHSERTSEPPIEPPAQLEAFAARWNPRTKQIEPAQLLFLDPDSGIDFATI